MEYKDYYKILGVNKTASQDEIKKTYRKLAVKYHPDKNKGDAAAEERFKEISEAYNVLGDPEKRKKYDELGSGWNQYRHAGGDPSGFDWSQYARQNGGGQTRHEFQGDFGNFFGGNGGFSDFFQNIFGGGGFAQARARSGAAGFNGFKGQDFRASLGISLEDAFTGTTRSFALNGQQLRIKLKPGIENGQTLKLKGKGAPGPQGGPNGDLYLTVEVEENPQFRREGKDLYTTVPVDLYSAILGGKVTIPTLSGPVNLTLPPQTQNDKVFRLKGKGMPEYGNAAAFGDLYVTIKVELPQQLSAEEEDLFRKLRDLKQSKYAGSF